MPKRELAAVGGTDPDRAEDPAGLLIGERLGVTRGCGVAEIRLEIYAFRVSLRVRVPVVRSERLHTRGGTSNGQRAPRETGERGFESRGSARPRPAERCAARVRARSVASRPSRLRCTQRCSSLAANDRIGCTIVIAFMWSTRRRRRSTTSTATAQVIPTRAQLQGQRRGIGVIRALEVPASSRAMTSRSPAWHSSSIPGCRISRRPEGTRERSLMRRSLVGSRCALRGWDRSPAAASAHVLRVGTYKGIPGQFTTIQAAVDAARSG